LRLLLGSCETFRIVGLALSRSLSILILAFGCVANLGESGRAGWLVWYPCGCACRLGCFHSSDGKRENIGSGSLLLVLVLLGGWLPLPCGDEFDLAVTGLLIQHLGGPHPALGSTLVKARLPIGSTRSASVFRLPFLAASAAGRGSLSGTDLRIRFSPTQYSQLDKIHHFTESSTPHAEVANFAPFLASAFPSLPPGFSRWMMASEASPCIS
jgi:hypothetical protein